MKKSMEPKLRPDSGVYRKEEDLSRRPATKSAYDTMEDVRLEMMRKRSRLKLKTAKDRARARLPAARRLTGPYDAPKPDPKDFQDELDKRYP